LETFVLIQRERDPDDGVGACTSSKHGLKEFSFETDEETNATLATAWTNMLQKINTSTILDLRKANCEVKYDSEMCSAVAKGP
jgi:hypothetical protein